MKGKVKFSAKNVHIRFQFTIERNVTIITGDSGTGKTKLINMVRQYAELGRQSGVSLNCDKACIVLEGRNWETILKETHSSVVFIEESTSFLRTHEFAKAIQGTDNYYVIVTREPLPQLPYSVESIHRIVKKGANPKIDKVYKKISIGRISDFPYDVVVVEDSHSGYEFFCKATENIPVQCVSANGKSNLLNEIKRHKGQRLLLIADAAALGSEIRELEEYRHISSDKIDFFLPESFEWLILRSKLFVSNASVNEILSKPVNFVESAEYFSWERFFEYLLEEETKDSKDLKYDKKKLAKGYTTEARIKMILEAPEK